jgi:hypothetical protein
MQVVFLRNANDPEWENYSTTKCGGGAACVAGGITEPPATPTAQPAEVNPNKHYGKLV